MIDVAEKKIDMEGAGASVSVLEKETPKRRGRPRKVTLPATPSTPSCTEDKKHDNVTSVIQSAKKHEIITDIEDSTIQMEKATPRKRGRPKKTPLPPTPSSPSSLGIPDVEKLSEVRSSRRCANQSRNGTPELLVAPQQKAVENGNTDTPVSSGRGRKRKATSFEDEEKSNVVAVKAKLSSVVCGVCKKEMPEPNFTYHRYSVHYGLARKEGASQEFTEAEKAQELKKTLEKIKRLSCSKCPTSFTTLLGFQYHQKRCGVDVADLQNMMNECTICGKRVMALSAHMKVHEKRTDKPEEKKETSIAAPSPVTPGTKSKRAAAQKAANLLRELTDDIKDAPIQTPLNKAVKLFTEPSSAKVTNSIIGAWKKQIQQKSTAQCRYPSCPFDSDDIEKLKEHHVKCEIGLKSKFFACLKCAFRSQERSAIMEHVLASHVSEKDAAFELSGDSSADSTDDEEVNEEEEECESDVSEGNEKRKSIPQNTKNIEKAYGLTCNILQQFKSLSTSQLIPRWLAQFHKRNFSWSASIFKDWLPKTQKFVNTPSSYFPSNAESVQFARRVVNVDHLFPVESDFIYERLQLFQAKLQNGTPMFYCGGSIQSSAWCPMPAIVDESTSLERDQYLALSVFHEEHRPRSASGATFTSDYLIQIWNCGKLHNAQSAQEIPELDLCVAHSHGRVWSLVWCPSGCYDDQRLGLLAAACSDGTIRIFSIPNVSTLDDEINKPLIVRAEVSVTLCLNTIEGSECVSLDWDSTSGHRFIVAGFANGVVGLWDLHAKSPLLLRGNSLYPIWSFYAHSSVVSAVTLSPHHKDARFIATASTDRTIKLWDRQDLTVPISWSKRSRITDIRWRRHWPGILVSLEDVWALFRSSSVFYDFGYTGNRQSLLPQNSVVWSTAENEYLDVIAHCTDAGEVVVYASHFAVFDCDEKKLRKQRILILRTDLVDTNDTKNVFLNRMQKAYTETSSKKASDKKIDVHQTTETTTYSLIFNDVATSVVQTFGKQRKNGIVSETMDVLRPCDEPLASINKISFNPNFQSHTWMCVCGENGLVQLLRIDSPSTSKVGDCYIKEINNSSIDNDI